MFHWAWSYFAAGSWPEHKHTYTHCYTRPHLATAHYNHWSSTISCRAVPLDQFRVSSLLKDNSTAAAEGAVGSFHLFSQPKLATSRSPAYSLTFRLPGSFSLALHFTLPQLRLCAAAVQSQPTVTSEPLHWSTEGLIAIFKDILTEAALWGCRCARLCLWHTVITDNNLDIRTTIEQVWIKMWWWQTEMNIRRDKDRCG